MKTYKVKIEETVHYEVEVEAENVSEAEDKALDTFVTTRDRDQFFVSVEAQNAFMTKEVKL